MLFASIVTCVIVLADRALGLAHAWPLLAAPGAFVLLAFLVSGALRREPAQAATIELDSNLGLADRMTTGVSFSGGEHENAFEQLALRDAERAAAKVDLRRGVPVRATRVHRWWPLTTAAAVAFAVWLPALAPRAEAPSLTTAADQEERTEASERVSEAIEDAAMALEEQPELFDEQTRRDLESLERIQEELESPQGDPEEAEARAAETLSGAAERLEEQAAAEQRTLDATAERFDGLTDASDPLAEALAEGDFQAAAEELRAIEESLEQMDAAQREQTAQRLRDIAESIDSESEPDAPDPAERLAEEGVDPATAEELANETGGDPDSVREALEERGADPIEAQRISEELRKDAQQREAQREAQRNAQEFSESLDQAAGECENPSSGESGQPSSSQGSEQPGQQQQQQQGDPGDSGGVSGFQRAQETAERMDESSDRAAQRRSAAESMRQNASRLAQGDDEQAPGGAGGLAGNASSTPRTGAPERNDALRTETIDARQGSDSTRVMAEVEAEGPAVPERRASTAEAQETLREAAPSAERAIENQGVPARYRNLVRRYFRPTVRPTSENPDLSPSQDDPS